METHERLVTDVLGTPITPGSERIWEANMDTDKLGQLTRRAYLLELAIAGLAASAELSPPADPGRHFEPVQELAAEIHRALRKELDAELHAREITRRLKA